MKDFFTKSPSVTKRARVRLVLTVFVGLCVATLAFIQFPTGSQAVQGPQMRARSTAEKPQRFVPGEILVRYRSESMALAREGMIDVSAPDGARISGRVERLKASEIVRGLRRVRVAPDETLRAVAALKRQPDVLYAEPNYILHTEAVPNDPLRNLQYAIGKIGVQQVWDNFTTGNSSVVVGVIDQGIDFNHADLAANMWLNPGEIAGNGIDDDQNGCIDDMRGCNFTLPEPQRNGNVFSGDDLEFHASHVAGILGAVGNNGIGVTGVNWTTRLMSLKFLATNGFGDTGDAIDACAYALQMRQLWNSSGQTKGANVRVLNASVGGSEFSQAFVDVLNQLNNGGILFVAAAGNVGDGARQPNNNLIPHFPSDFDVPNVIAVASTNESENLSAFSHFGATTVDLGAPGEGILSTTPPCSDPGPPETHPCTPSFPANPTPTQDTYSVFDGTSMATPQVTGAAALLWAQNPNLTVAQVKNLLLLNGDVQPALVDKTLTGRRLNIFKSFQSMQEADSTAPGAVTNFQVLFQNGRNINLSWTAAGDDGPGNGPAALYEISFIDGATSAVIPLKGVVPVAPGSSQTTQVTMPYRHTSGTLRLRPFDNKGNEGVAANIPVSIPALDGDPYVVSVGGPAALTPGGTRLQLEGDDRYTDFLLPPGFSIPFFGTNFTEVTISTNGNLFFSDAPIREHPPLNPADNADDPPGSPRYVGGHQMIAGLWADLDLSTTNRTDAGVYMIQPSPSQVIFRWRATRFGCDAPCAQINFEIELNTDGTIRTRYGDNATGTSTVGIGGGNQDGYVVTSHSSETELNPLNLTNAGQVTFSPRSQWSTTVLDTTQVELRNWQFEAKSWIYVKLNFPDAGFRVTDWGSPTHTGNDYSVNASIERFNGASAQAISNTAQIYDLGVLPAGNYTFAFKNSGTTVKTLNFTVSAAPPAPNPIDDAREFVRWQYKDFLRREPDGPGWDHWTGEITECSTDVTKRFPGETESQCIERKRANTSAAFFLSPEFQNTGYFVLRVYRGSLGRMPHFGGSGTASDEFTRDAGTISQGIVVNDSLAPAVINANKQAFVNQFVTRPEFRAIYDPLNNTQYVDRLFQTTGVTPTASERQALIDGLGNSSETRASVLFKVVDGTTTVTDGHLMFNTNYGKAFYDNLFNAAFVQMEYFGYLLRDPDDGGYNFWLGKLNQFGNWVDAQMVLAFIKSPEYRSRFGQP